MHWQLPSNDVTLMYGPGSLGVYKDLVAFNNKLFIPKNLIPLEIEETTLTMMTLKAALCCSRAQSFITNQQELPTRSANISTITLACTQCIRGDRWSSRFWAYRRSRLLGTGDFH